jgi:hypothetical protein
VKRVAVVLVLVVLGVVVVKALGDATQTREDVRDRGKMTEIVFHLEGRNYRQSLDTAANGLFGKCTATVSGTLVDPGITAMGGGTYKFAVTPTLGHHGQERLLGCMNDLSIDRLKSNVESVEHVPLKVAAAKG